MSVMIHKSLDSPEEVRPFEDDMGHLDMVNLGAAPVGRAVFEPGWRWSEHVKPIAKTDSCEMAHTGYVVSGRITIAMDSGEKDTYEPGDFMIVPPGHDAWVEGDEACVVIDWQGYADYAKPPAD
ncbi:cupin domain-containing protein [Actinospica robiniae]|uniref:cupin domain-containing protein n=1 Tax=Actinospica robiniae TaxID=304901 RepID=UPI00041DE2DD|nr:cupin domain-containing protein [Actinospica robiniae]